MSSRMSSLRTLAVATIVSAVRLSSTHAEVHLPAQFSDHMVIQRGVSVPIWGKAEPGEEVRVSIAGKEFLTTADHDGSWKTALTPIQAEGPHELLIQGKNTLRVTDVLAGEVWLASGQSNMDFTVARTDKYYFAGTAGAEAEIAAANYPKMRMFTADWTMRDQPQQDVVGQWKVCTPENVREFSAVAYFFARDLHDALKTPIGIITCTYGASTAQAWTSREALSAQATLKPFLEKFDEAVSRFAADEAAKGKYAQALERWKTAVESAAETKAKAPRQPKNPDPIQDQHNPTVLFNGMIAPVIPYAIRGVIWYQGESNTADAKIYPLMQKTLIEDWRARWGDGSLPFYLVQLANHHAPSVEPGNSRLATMREAQAEALALPSTGMAVTIDIGDEKDVHPRNKQDVGNRLARIALAKSYQQLIESSGPVFDSKEVVGDSMRLRFQHADGLHAKGGALKQFAIAGSDGRFVWAEAKIQDGLVVVRSPEVPLPTSVRYAWADNPDGCNLYNSTGLPAVPFRTDR